jgi:hypothetical protein
VTLKIVKLSAEKHFSSEDVVITGSLTNDLITLGMTEEEVNTYFLEIEILKSKGLPEDLKEAWGHKQLPKFTIEFRDNWDSDVKNYISELVRNIIIEENFSGKFIFYGLNSSRGRVISTDSRLVGQVNALAGYDHIRSVKSLGKYAIGIPSSIRGSLSETKRCEVFLKEVIGGLINPSKYITKKKKTEVYEAMCIPEDLDPTWYTASSTTYPSYITHR